MKNILAKIFAILAALIIIAHITSGVICASMESSGLGILSIVTLEGTMYSFINDFIIKGVRGEFYPCNPDIFYETYIEKDI